MAIEEYRPVKVFTKNVNQSDNERQIEFSLRISYQV